MSAKLLEVKQIVEDAASAGVAPSTVDDREAQYGAVEAMFNVIARVLAIRFFLFLSLVGSFALSFIATKNQSVLSVWIVGVFALVTTLPLTVLEIRNKRGG